LSRRRAKIVGPKPGKRGWKAANRDGRGRLFIGNGKTHYPVGMGVKKGRTGVLMPGDRGAKN